MTDGTKEYKKTNRLIGRKCVHCEREIKMYTLCGIYIPTENNSIIYKTAFENDDNNTYIIRERSSLLEVHGLFFMHICECGATSTWSLNKDELEYLSMNKDNDYGITWVYNKEDWLKYIENVENEQVKNDLQKTLRLIETVYPD